MAEKVDLSLDDIIKMNKKHRGGNNSKQNLQKLRNLGAKSGIIRKGGPKQGNKTLTKHKQQQVINKREPTMLHVANLHYNVSTRDVRELFSEIEPVLKATVHYDKSGRSLGTAEVIFSNREAALDAMKKYQNVPLDSRPMNITLVPIQNKVSRQPTKSRIGVKVGSGIFKKSQAKVAAVKAKARNNNNSNTVSTKAKFQRRQTKPTVTAEQLDADLEAYTMNIG